MLIEITQRLETAPQGVLFDRSSNHARIIQQAKTAAECGQPHSFWVNCLLHRAYLRDVLLSSIQLATGTNDLGSDNRSLGCGHSNLKN